MTKKKNDQEVKGILGRIERLGNALPHPAFLFIILSAIIIVIAEIMTRKGVSVTYFDARQNADITVKAASLMNAEGLRYIFSSAVGNFVNFAPLGVVLVTMLGIGAAEQTGLLGSAFQSLLLSVNPRILTAGVVFIGVISNIASDAGYVVVVPLGGLIFAMANRHPIAGITAAFAGVSGGFSANLIFGPTDVTLAGITNSVLEMTNSDMTVNAPDNWYFLIASTFIITLVGTLVTEKIIIPNLGEYKGSYSVEQKELTDLEKKGLKNAGIVLLIFVVIMALLMAPKNAVFKSLNETTGKVDLTNFMGESLIFAVLLLFMLPGVAYGKATGAIKNTHDFIGTLIKSMESMSGFIVMAFFASQFIAFFGQTNIGTIIAVSGADFLKSVGLGGIPLIILFVLLTSFINLFIGSASAKWAIMAPIFVPMFMNLGLSPALTQMAYRIADSSTNIISPLMNYFAIIVVFMQKYDKDTGIGTLISTMIPYSLSFLASWTVLLIIWMVFKLPLGPGVGLFM